MNIQVQTNFHIRKSIDLGHFLQSHDLILSNAPRVGGGYASVDGSVSVLRETRYFIETSQKAINRGSDF